MMELKIIQCFSEFLNNFQKNANGNRNSVWKSKRLSDKSIKSPSLSNDSLAPSLNYVNTKLLENLMEVI